MTETGKPMVKIPELENTLRAIKLIKETTPERADEKDKPGVSHMMSKI